MYNRYVPGHNGNYERFTVVDRCPIPQKEPHDQNPTCHPQTETAQQQACSHRKSLFDFDLGDLLLLCIVILLAIDSDEDDLFPILIMAAVFLMQS